MYTAVSMVQARNKDNAEKVGEAMKMHAEMGLESQRRSENERQMHQGGGDGGRGGGAPDRGGGSSTTGRGGGELIAVDPETFEVVRQIQALRNDMANKNASTSSTTPTDSSTTAPSPGSSLSPDPNHGTTGPSGGPTGPSGPPASAVDSLSDEKLINLFLLMARGPNWPGNKSGMRGAGGGGQGMGGVASSGGGGQGGNVGGEGGGGGGGSGEGGMGGGGVGGAGMGGGGMGGGGDVMDGVEAMFAVPSMAQAPLAAGGDGGGRGGGEGEGGWGNMQLTRRHEDTVLSEVQRALRMLHEVDSVLEQLALFWANSEVIFDVLLRKGDLVEKFVAFASKPRLLQRFKERLADYKRFWEGVQGVCNKYVCGQLKCNGGVRTPGAGGRGGGGGVGGVGGGGGSLGGYSHRSHSASSVASGISGDGGVGSGEGGMSAKEGLGGVGGWANMEMGLDADESQ
ncbi:unnamed protein product [Laminaria digitata]